MSYQTERGVTRVLDIPYIKLLRLLLKTITAWPYKDIGEAPQKYAMVGRSYTLCLELMCLPPGLLYIKNSVGTVSFFELGHSYITFFMNLVAFSRCALILTKKYNDIGRDFLLKIHLFNHKDQSEYSMKTHLLVHKISHFTTLYLCLLMFLGIFLFNLIPIINNITSGAFQRNRPENVTFEHSVYYALPFDYRTELKGFLSVFIFNWYISIICSSFFCTFDSFLVLLVFHTWGHIRILTHNLENFPRPRSKLRMRNPWGSNIEVDWFTKEEENMVAMQLRDILIHHQLILDFIFQMADTFGLVLFIYYGFHQVSGCLLLLECSQMDTAALLRYGPLTLVIFQQLIQISMVFELLGIMSDKLMKAAYNLPWECMDNSNRRTCCMILRRVQIPLSLKALDMVDVGSKTMVNILKTTFSYFIILKTMASDE